MGGDDTLADGYHWQTRPISLRHNGTLRQDPPISDISLNLGA